MTDELRNRLTAAGRAPAPPPRAEFTDALEARLRGVHATGVTTGFGGRRLRAGRLLVAAACVAMLALVLGLTTVANNGGGSGSDTLRLASATDALAVLPDGTVVDAVAGLTLPDGTVIRTGASGDARVDGVRLGANAEGVIVDGRLRLRTDARPAPTTTPPPTRPSPTTTVVQSPPPTRPPTTTTTVAPAKPAPLRLAATASRDGTVELHWSRYEGQGFDRYIVLRRLGRDQPPPAPAYPPDSGTQVVAESRSVDGLAFTDHMPDRVPRASYRVIAVTADGRLLATSPSVAVAR